MDLIVRKSCFNNLVWVNGFRMFFKNYKYEVCFYLDLFFECYMVMVVIIIFCKYI